MRKPKKVKPKKQKKAKEDFSKPEVVIDDIENIEEISDKEKEEWKKEFLDKNLCKCGKHPLKPSMGMCPECYMNISNEMARTVSKDDSEPWKLNGTYKRLQNLIDGE